MRTAPWCAWEEEDQLAAPDLLAETSETRYAHQGFAAQSAANMGQCCSIAALLLLLLLLLLCILSMLHDAESKYG